MNRDNKIIAHKEEVFEKIQSATAVVRDVAAAAYGVKSGNVLIERQFGDPIVSHDGITNVRDIYLKDSVENGIARLIVQASNKSNQIAGDGTTCTVLFTAALIREGQKQIAAGVNPMILKQRLTEMEVHLQEFINKQSTVVDSPEKLIEVAKVSAGNAGLGEQIARTIIEAGENAGVTIEESPTLGVESEVIDGIYFESGFINPQMANDGQGYEAKMEKVPVVITQKTISSNSEIIPILQQVNKSDNQKLLLIGDVVGDAFATIMMNNIQGNHYVVVVKPPVYGGLRDLFLADLAIATGARLIPNGEDAKKFDITNDTGYAEKAVIRQENTILFGADPEEGATEERIQQIKDQIGRETNAIKREQQEKRLAQLEGKIAVFRVGGAVEAEQREMKLRVEDAVQATRAAREHGIVPGGATTLMFAGLSVTGEYADIMRQACAEPFKILMRNAGLNADLLLAEVQDKGFGYGVDVLNADLDHLKDAVVPVMEAGIIDPTLVMREIVTNAVSTAANILTTTVAVTNEIKEETK